MVWEPVQFEENANNVGMLCCRYNGNIIVTMYLDTKYKSLFETIVNVLIDDQNSDDKKAFHCENITTSFTTHIPL